MQDHALLAAFLDLVEGRGHHGAGLQAGHVDLVGAQADRGAGAVVGDRAAAEHDDVAGDVHGMALTCGLEEGSVDVDAVELVALGRQHGALVGAERDEHRVVALAQQVLGLCDALAAAQLDAGRALGVARAGAGGLQDVGNLVVERLVGHAVGGDAVAQLAAGLLIGLEDGHGVALAGQVVGGGEARGAGAHNGDLLAGQRVVAHVLLPRAGLVGRGGALLLADGDGLVDLAVFAVGLAGVGAHAAERLGEGHALVDDARCVVVVAQADGAQVLGHIDMRGAGGAAGHDVVLAGLIGVVVPQHVDDRAGRADLDAGAAETAARVDQGHVAVGADADALLGALVVEHLDAAHLAAGAHAAAAADAAGEHVRDQRIGLVGGHRAALEAPALRRHAHELVHGLQLADAELGAARAVGRVGREDQLHGHLAHAVGLGRVDLL